MSQSDFDKANEVVHSVESQWHYPILSAAGFIPVTQNAIGFVRSYNYEHPDGRTVKCTTGSRADYWAGRTAATDENNGDGYWGTLEKWVKDTATQPPETAL